MTLFKPMKPPQGVLEDRDLPKLLYPLEATIKLDGFRFSIQESQLLSSTLKLIPNKQLQAKFGHPMFNGLDGEIVDGDPTDGLAFNRTSSTVGSENGDASNCALYVFDKFHPTMGYLDRVAHAVATVMAAPQEYQTEKPQISVLKPVTVKNLQEFLYFEKLCAEAGYEGAMYRQPEGCYKQGRSTLTEQGLLRRKPMVDGEATVIGFECEKENKNPEKRNELGLMKRSTCKANMVDKDTLGKFIVRGLTVFPGVEFKVGSFGTMEECRQMWQDRESLMGRILKFKYQMYGSKDKPRIPIALGFRNPEDMTEY